VTITDFGAVTASGFRRRVVGVDLCGNSRSYSLRFQTLLSVLGRRRAARDALGLAYPLARANRELVRAGIGSCQPRSESLGEVVEGGASGDEIKSLRARYA